MLVYAAAVTCKYSAIQKTTLKNYYSKRVQPLHNESWDYGTPILLCQEKDTRKIRRGILVSIAMMTTYVILQIKQCQQACMLYFVQIWITVVEGEGKINEEGLDDLDRNDS